jgi:hypothetical protein
LTGVVGIDAVELGRGIRERIGDTALFKYEIYLLTAQDTSQIASTVVGAKSVPTLKPRCICPVRVMIELRHTVIASDPIYPRLSDARPSRMTQ